MVPLGLLRGEVEVVDSATWVPLLQPAWRQTEIHACKYMILLERERIWWVKAGNLPCHNCAGKQQSPPFQHPATPAECLTSGGSGGGGYCDRNTPAASTLYVGEDPCP